MRRIFGYASVSALLGAAICLGAYAMIGSTVDADGILREPFFLIPLGYLCMFAAICFGLAYLFMRRRGAAQGAS